MPPATVVYLVSTLKRTGPTTQLFNLVKNLDSNRFRPQIVTLSPEPADSLKSRFLTHGIDVIALDLSRLQGLFSANNHVRAVIGETGAQLVHTQGIRADSIASNLNVSGLSRLATLRNYPQIDYPLTYGRVLGKLMALVHTHRLRKLNLTVGVSRAVSENLKSLAPDAKTTTVMNGVDTVFFSPADQSEKHRIRDQLGIPSDRTVWIASGHLSERKDPLTLVEGFRKAFGGDDSQLLVLIGAGPLEAATSELAEGSANIRLEGRVSDVKSYLRASDFYVSASVGEGLPNAALEAMACGLPVLLSDIAPHRQLLKMDARIGADFCTSDVGSLQKAFRQMLSYDTTAMRQSAINLTEQQLSASAMADNYQKLYDQLLAEGAQQ